MPTPNYPPVAVSLPTAQLTSTITRPADTTAYADGDEISNSTTSPTIRTFSGAARSLGGSGSIQGACISSSNPAATAATLELWIFTATSTPTVDNSAFAPTDAVTDTCVAVIPLTAYKSANNILYDSGSISRPYVCAAADTALYGRLVVRNAYNPANAETLKITLHVIQD